MALFSTLAVLGVGACSDDDGPGPDAALSDGAVTDAAPDGALDGGADGDGGADADAGSPLAPARSCETVFRYEPTDPVSSVQVAGEWDWSTPETMTPDGAGAYTLTKRLDPGLYAYKLIVDGQWMLDPGNPYRKYDGGIENSGMRVPDCRDPLLRLVSFQRTAGGATARVALLRGGDDGSGGGGNDGAGAPLDASAIAVVLGHDFQHSPVAFTHHTEAHELEVTLSGLADGKYTLRFEAADEDGRSARPLRIPFWVEPEPFDFRDSAIYMVFLDRFRDGNPGNNPGPTAGAAPTADWYGGDLAGVTAAIEQGYFDTLGIRTLWLSPFQRNPDVAYDEHGHGVTGYHGYWPIRARELDPRFGTEAELEALVTAAHARGIRILMDYVINHVHEDHEYYVAHPEWFRTGCRCGDAGCDWTAHRLDCLFQMYLPDVNWENPDVGEAIIADALWWLERFDLDGLRVDAVKHVEDAAIFNLSTRVHEALEQGGTEYFLLGETAMGWGGPDIANSLGEYATISRYIGERGLNGQFDFVLYHAVSYNTWAHDTYGLVHADYWTQASLDHYPADAVMTPYIGSHDTQRFISLADPAAAGVVYNKWPSDGLPDEPATDDPYGRLRVALAWTLTLPGAPLLYYGDEYGEYGGSDPDNRHRWRPAAQRSTREADLFDVVAAVGRARRDSAALRRGAYTSLMAEEPFLVYARHTASDLALVALNHSDAPITRSVTLPGTVPQPSADLEDALDPTAAPVSITNNAVLITVAPRDAVILVPATP